MIEQQIWRSVKGAEEKYQVSDLGNVRNIRSGRILKPATKGAGYKTVSIFKEIRYIHRIVAESFLPNPENKPEVNHKDLNKGNNKLSNLEWCTRQENVDHKYNLSRLRALQTIKSKK